MSDGGAAGIVITSSEVITDTNSISNYGTDCFILHEFGTDTNVQIRRTSQRFFNLKQMVLKKYALTSTGRLGIGTTNPQNELHVVGSARLTGTSNLLFEGTSNVIYYPKKLVTNGQQYFSIEDNGESAEILRLNDTGALKLNLYGDGTFTGTATYRLAVDTDGNVIEIPIGSGPVDGSGAANKVAIWSDADTLTSDTNLHWDSTNDRLGVGLSNPSYTIHIPDGSSNASPDHAIAIGNDADIKLYRHSNTGVNVIEGDSSLNIRTNTMTFQNQAGTETLFKGVADAGFEAYYNNAKELETISQGVNIRVKSIIPSAGNTNGGYWLYGTHAHGFVF